MGGQAREHHDVRVGLPGLGRSLRHELGIAARVQLEVLRLGLVGVRVPGGFGQVIFTGLYKDDKALILQGAIPTALLALAVQGLFELAERLLVPGGLRLKRQE